MRELPFSLMLDALKPNIQLTSPDQRADMERPVNYLQWFSFFAPLEALQVAVKEAVATVDHPDIRGSMPHNRDSSGAASDKRRGLVRRLSA